jgi:hypothetical protein
VLERLADRYRVSDAFVLVTGEYNHGVQSGTRVGSAYRTKRARS